ncbi:uncharacterized protein LOC127250360 isoform X2 [Andrographis paniculata]|uniref:uncharacterized protein LOC127250360 isoform X2 n=1 Tax=Andrographis paniculata TaxID=175694 RepID=UPI0021E83B1D|nr:uncharacterized protein LOC127250360 isoform X2 [Andrographis paniculata]
MGKKKSTKKESGRVSEGELLKTLEDFTVKDNWDKFFTLRGADDSFEWYAEWPELQAPFMQHLLSPAVSILVPGCGNSRLSEHLYDAGFSNITNVDFSKVVITDMLRRNVRERPRMKWRVMDMTSMQCESESFDAVIDKGGLDALMEPKHGPVLGYKYLSEVKRVLKSGGKYICLTLAEPHVLDILFPKFRFGWKMSIYNIAQKSSSRNPKLLTFMVVCEKDVSNAVSEILSFLDKCAIESCSYQVPGLYDALEREKVVRLDYINGSDLTYSLEDLTLGAKGDLTVVKPGRRIKLVLGEPGLSRYYYNGVLLDAPEDYAPFKYYYAVFIVPKVRVHEWLFSSEEGQWLIVANSKAARLVVILLDSGNSNAAMEDIQVDLSPLVKNLTPKNCDDAIPIPFLSAGDGIKQRDIVYEVVSLLTGPIIVDDVIYDRIDDVPSKDFVFRRLIFQRAETLVQSDALLSTEGSDISSSEANQMKVKTETGSGSKKKGKQKKSSSLTTQSNGSCSQKKIDHDYLASSYHSGIISGLMLFSRLIDIQGSTSEEGKVKTVVIGLGAGLLPMFMRKWLPILDIKAIELDPVVFDVARKYFGFVEDDHLKVHIMDGIKYVQDKGNAAADGKGSCINILIIDVDSTDSSSGLTCPATDFVEESFLLSVKNSLTEQGIFVINLVSRSPSLKAAIYSRLKALGFLRCSLVFTKQHKTFYALQLILFCPL